MDSKEKNDILFEKVNKIFDELKRTGQLPDEKKMKAFEKSAERSVKRKKDKKPDFKCPICGCKKYREHRSLIREMRYGGDNPTKLDCYSCAGCSVNFYNPTQFTNAGKKKRTARKRRKA
jgi:hypothetical protein